MKLYGVPATALCSIVFKVAGQYNGNLMLKSLSDRKTFCTFTIRVRDSKGKGARNSASGRRTTSACWCAHRDVIGAIFARYPNARLISAIATYNGKADFDNNHAATRSHQCGSIMNPAFLGHLCEACA